MSKKSLLNFQGLLPSTLMASFLVVSGWAANSNAQSLARIRVQTFTSTAIDTTLGSTTLTQLPSPVFTYNKVSGTSLLKITYQDTVANRGPFASTCVYQVRVNGQPSQPNLPFSSPILIASNIVNTSLSSVGIFRGLPTGPQRLSIWQRQAGATQCIRNSGGFVTTITVEEFEPF